MIWSLGEILNFLSMALAPQVMLSCLGATALIFNALFGRLILQELMHEYEIMAIFGMICSVVMVISTTPVPADSVVLGKKEDGYDLLLQILGHIFALRFLILTVSIVLALAALRISAILKPDITPLVWTCYSAISSGYAVTFFKACSEFVTRWNTTLPYLHWQCYGVFLLGGLSGISQIHCLNHALGLGRAVVVVPAFCTLGLLAQLGISEVVCVDAPRSPIQATIFAVGIFLTIVFIVMLVRTRMAYEDLVTESTALVSDPDPEEPFRKARKKSLTSADQVSANTVPVMGIVHTSALAGLREADSGEEASQSADGFSGHAEKHLISKLSARK